MKKYIFFIIFLLILSKAMMTYAFDDNKYKKWKDTPSKELLEIGKEFENKQKMDNALMIYTIICNRAEEGNNNELKICCYAYIKKYNIYSSYYCDFNKAYENIKSAQELQTKSNTPYSFVDDATSTFYHSIASITLDEIMEKKALKHGIKAYYTAYKENNKHSMHSYMFNILKMTGNVIFKTTKDTDDISIIEDIWKTYKDDNSYDYRMNKIFYDILQLYKIKDYNKIIIVAKDMLKLSTESSDYKRIFLSFNCILDSYYMLDEYTKAIEYLTKEENLARRINSRNNIIKAVSTKEKIFRYIGENKKADSCLNKYLLLEDSLLNHNRINNINKILYGGEYMKMEKEINEMNLKNRFYNDFIIFASLFTFILIIMIIILYKKNRQLKKSNITIYENNIATLKREQKEREKLKNYIISMDKSAIIEDYGEINSEEKYKKNCMSDDEKKKLLNKILNVMTNIDEICSESFSVSRLAELTNSKYNYVSLVINENYGCNFNSFLNKFRIQEACRRLADDKNYGMYTIDTISASIGFKSKSTLNKSFKKIVGLTPSQYRNIAKEKKQSSHDSDDNNTDTI